MFREEIRTIIEMNNLIISESKNLIFPDWALKIIYSDLPEKYRDVVFQPLNGVSVEAGLVVGENAIDRFLQITGTKLDPVDCAPESIRFKFGGQKPLIIDGVRYYINIIHRSQNKREAEKDIKVFHAL